MSILKSFETGDRGEKKVISVLSSIGISATKNTDKDTRADYDLEFEYEGKRITAEVKYDVMSEKTGNVAFEFFNSKSNKPSGIYGTKANLWFHLLPDGDNVVVCVCKTKKVRDFCHNEPPLRILKSVGDNNADIMLYKVDVVLENLFDRIDNISNEQILKIIKRYT